MRNCGVLPNNILKRTDNEVAVAEFKLLFQYFTEWKEKIRGNLLIFDFLPYQSVKHVLKV